MAEAGDRGARDAILQIIQRDPLPEKRKRAEKLLARLGPGLTTNRLAGVAVDLGLRRGSG